MGVHRTKKSTGFWRNNEDLVSTFHTLSKKQKQKQDKLCREKGFARRHGTRKQTYEKESCSTRGGLTAEDIVKRKKTITVNGETKTVHRFVSKLRHENALAVQKRFTPQDKSKWNGNKFTSDRDPTTGKQLRKWQVSALKKGVSLNSLHNM